MDLRDRSKYEAFEQHLYIKVLQKQEHRSKVNCNRNGLRVTGNNNDIGQPSDSLLSPDGIVNGSVGGADGVVVPDANVVGLVCRLAAEGAET